MTLCVKCEPSRVLGFLKRAGKPYRFFARKATSPLSLLGLRCRTLRNKKQTTHQSPQTHGWFVFEPRLLLGSQLVGDDDSTLAPIVKGCLSTHILVLPVAWNAACALHVPEGLIRAPHTSSSTSKILILSRRSVQMPKIKLEPEAGRAVRSL